MMKNLFSKRFKDLSIAIAQGTCYRGLLASKGRLEYRTIGLCISIADSISALRQCRKTILVDEDSAESYLFSTKSDLFVSNEAIISSNPYITPQEVQEEMYVIVHELIEFYQPIVSSSMEQFVSNNSSIKGNIFDPSQSYSKLETILQEFLDDGQPKLVFIKGKSGISWFNVRNW